MDDLVDQAAAHLTAAAGDAGGARLARLGDDLPGTGRELLAPSPLRIREELAAGAWKVITEARKSGTGGIFRGSGEVRSGLIDEIVHELPVERLLFEAPQKGQPASFIRQFGANLNLGNIPPDKVIPLETLRLGLRSDTMSALLLNV